jgi:glycolate oxidase FAD binding subunit
VRDHVLEVRFETGDGRLVKGGGPTVKNVTGYDLPRLFVGSLGTIGVLHQVTLRCRPRLPYARWFRGPDTAGIYRPSARLWSGEDEHVLIEGVQPDVDAQGARFSPLEGGPSLPEGTHRGRISVDPKRARDCARGLPDQIRWCAELGVGTVHVAADTPELLASARSTAQEHGGWMLREAGGGPDDDGFGVELPNVAIMRRIKAAFDPDLRLNATRLPLGTRVDA